jgi:hypothetical protein
VGWLEGNLFFHGAPFKENDLQIPGVSEELIRQKAA